METIRAVSMELGERLSRNFTLGELIRSENAARKGIDNTPPPTLIPKLRRLCVELLEPVREYYQRPFRPNSGYRSLELNRDVGGSPRSQHCRAEAVDIEIAGISNYELACWVRDNLTFDQVILECYSSGEPASGWVHVSLKGAGEVNRAVALTYSDQTFSNGLLA